MSCFRERLLSDTLFQKLDKDDTEIPVFNTNKLDTLYKNGPDASCHAYLLYALYANKCPINYLNVVHDHCHTCHFASCFHYTQSSSE